MPPEDRSGSRSLFSRIRSLFQRDESAPEAGSVRATPLSLENADPADLLQFAQEAPLVYGFWGDFKRLYKQAEAAQDWNLLPTLISRLDTVAFAKNAQPLVSTVDGIGTIQRVQAQGDLVILQAGDWNTKPGVFLFDFSNPALPKRLSKVEFHHLAGFLAHEKHLYVLEGQQWGSRGHLHVFDISDPRNPRKLTRLEVAPYATLAIAGATLALLSQHYQTPGLQLVDIAQPAAPRIVGSRQIRNPYCMAADGQRVLVLTQANYRGNGQMHVIDISNPARPNIAQEFNLFNATDIAISGRFAYVTIGQDRWAENPQNFLPGLLIFSLGSEVQQVGALTLGSASAVAVAEPYAYITTEYDSAENPGGLRIVDISDREHPRLVQSFGRGQAQGIAAEDARVYLAARAGQQLQVVDVSDPEKPFLIGTPPKRATLGYMKRRARRALRTLALAAPDRYAKAAYEVLSQSGQGREEADRATDWVSMDLLFGGGNRTIQHGHGRGAYGIVRPGLSRTTREERHPELWDRHPELAGLLYANPNLPWQTHEAALKMLRANGIGLPALSDDTMARFLAGPSPLLASMAAQQIAGDFEAGKQVPAALAAALFLRGTRRHRRLILNALQSGSLPSAWRGVFAEWLVSPALKGVGSASLPRKQRNALLYLLENHASLLARQIQPEQAVALVATGRPEFARWLHEALARLSPTRLLAWLTALETLEEAPRERAVQTLLDGARGKVIELKAARDWVNAPAEWVRQTAWRLLAQSAISPFDLSRLWAWLLDSDSETDALRTAFRSPDALTLFHRCEFDSGKMQERIEQRPFLIPLMPVSVLEAVIRAVPVAFALTLIAQAADESWPGLRAAVLNGPLRSEKRAAFWTAAFAAIGATGDARLTRRLLDDAEISATLMDVEEAGDFLKSANPAFGPILGRWVRAHEAQFAKDSPELLTLATHMLPDIRDFGLQRVRELGMSLPFALRLLESELPPSVALGKTFFEAVGAEDARQMETITALCDSPKPSVRAYAIAVVRARWEELDRAGLLARLTENPDPQMQAFVAGQLDAQPPEAAVETQAFDRAVLRSRNRGRTAKEAVKARLTREPTQDVALLLELARSRTPRDAEWAMSELAKLAVQGVEIPGFTVEGVAGV